MRKNQDDLEEKLYLQVNLTVYGYSLIGVVTVIMTLSRLIVPNTTDTVNFFHIDMTLLV